MWNSTDVHHAARVGWGVGGRAGRGMQGEVDSEVLRMIESSACREEVRGEARGGGAGFDRKKCGP